MAVVVRCTGCRGASQVGPEAVGLAVVFTVDWTPATRIKGVLMLVGLSYFGGLSLYFLKKDMVDRAQEFLSLPSRWHQFEDPKGKYRVRLPVQLPRDSAPAPDQPL